MRYLAVILLVLLLVPGSGCDGDGDTTSGDGGDGGGSTVVIASGSVIVAGSTPVIEFMITQPGTLKAEVSWTAPPATLHIAFFHEGLLVDASLILSSPAIITKTVTASLVSAGPNWVLWLGNPGPNVTADYTVTFTPD